MNEHQSRFVTWFVPLLILLGMIALALTGWGEMAPAMRELAAAEVENRFGLTLLTLERPALMPQAELALLAGAGLTVVLLIAFGRPFWAGAVTLVALIVAWVVSWRLAADAGLFFDAAFASLGLSAVFLIGAGLHAAHVSDARMRVREAHAKHFSHKAAENIARRPHLLALSGETRPITYLVCNVNGFAARADSFRVDAPRLRDWTQRVMTPLTEAVLANGGTIGRVAPGTLTAFFNAPLDDPDHAIHASECALAMNEAVPAINVALQRERWSNADAASPVSLGIGIDTGHCAVADFGREGHPEYAVAGSAPSRAAEFARLTLKYGPGILAGSVTRSSAESVFAFLEVDLLGKADYAEQGSAPSPVFALLGNPQMRASPKFRALQAFHDHIFRSYRAGDWSRARALIEQCRTLSGANARLYDLYLNRIAYLETHPPGDGWDGVFRPPAS